MRQQKRQNMLKVNKSSDKHAKAKQRLAAIQKGATPLANPTPLPARKQTAPAVSVLAGVMGAIKLRDYEEVYVNLGATKSAKGCSLFYARQTEKGFVPTRDSMGQPVQALEVIPSETHIARSTFAKGNPTPDAYRAWVSERREEGCLVMTLKRALKLKLVRQYTAKVNGNPSEVYLPTTWQHGHRMPLYVGMMTPGGRAETFTHKVKRADGKARNHEFIAKVEVVS